MLTMGLCLAGFFIVAVFVVLCMICHAGNMSEIEILKAKEREWLRRGIENGKK